MAVYYKNVKCNLFFLYIRCFPYILFNNKIKRKKITGHLISLRALMSKVILHCFNFVTSYIKCQILALIDNWIPWKTWDNRKLFLYQRTINILVFVVKIEVNFLYHRYNSRVRSYKWIPLVFNEIAIPQKLR